MKPILLEMTAFGSYAQKTTVDFGRLTHDLYLITGDTGAGKTTIFDAIMFALYGAASGKGRNNKPSVMHCDFVDKSVDTVVTLTFRQGGRDYKVERTMHFAKVRGTADQFRDTPPSATLWELDRPEEPPVEGATKVTERCGELLGLNEDQFRKIVMLAQGEFKEFLSADGQKKEEILGKLFDNFPYIHCQELLDGARKKLEKEREEHNKQIESAMSFFQFPETMDDGQRALYLPGAPELSRRLSELAEADAAELAEKVRERDAYHEKEGILQTEKGIAEGRNRQLDELAQKRTELEELEKRRGAMDSLQKEVDAAEKALHQIQPKRGSLMRAEQLLQRTVDDIEKLTQERETWEKAVQKAQSAVDEDGDTVQAIKVLTLEVSALEGSLPKYQELAAKEREAEKAKQSVRRLEDQKGGLETKRDKETEALEEIDRELGQLEGIDAQLVMLEGSYQRARENTAALKVVQGRVSAVLQDEETFAQEQKMLGELTSTASELEQCHHNLYQRFLAGQAGLLAEELRQSVAENGSAVCPVCRSTLYAGQEHTFAELPEETPTKAEVDGAKEAFEVQEKLRNEQDKKTGKLETSIRDEKTRILQDVDPLLPDCGTWDGLIAAGYLTGELDRFRREEAAKKSERDRADGKQKHSVELKDRKLEKETLLEKLRTRISDVEQELGKAQMKVNTSETEIKGLREQLKHPDQAAAQAEIDKKTAERNRKQAQVNEHTAALADAKERWNRTSGDLEGKENSLPELKQEAADAEQALRTALTENGFAALTDADRALLPVGDADGETWLKEQRDELERYRRNRTLVQNRIKELSGQTADFSYTNLDELQAQLDETGSAYAAARDAYNRLDKLAENHRKTAERVACASQALADSKGAWDRLSRMADLAVGVNSEGGKMSFGRYVMGTVFREVLEMANLRLNVMSGGKYELIHQISAGRKDAKAGLDVEVLDMATGKQRSSDSLSGGESFLVSLSLALGLSDVVQHHAGGRKLDALFIDEGFGSLDSGALDTAMEVLNQLTQGSCLVGIISHVSRLEESIPQKIRVKSTESGSSLTFE